jgi:hypothetical protein
MNTKEKHMQNNGLQNIATHAANFKNSPERNTRCGEAACIHSYAGCMK